MTSKLRPLNKALSTAGIDDGAESLATLKSLLLGEELQQLAEVRKRFDDPAVRRKQLAEVLPDALRQSDDQGEDLTHSLQQPVTRCIKSSVAQDPQAFADALYPVMGPAIRQSISTTLKAMIVNLNRTLEHSLSLRGMKWRWQAARSGVPFAEVVLRHTLAYRVEQVFLIQNGSGLLIQHVQDPHALTADGDTVSGMLTAIAQFVRDAFQAEERDGLEQVDIGDHTVLLVHGPQAYLACVARGIPPVEMRAQCGQVLERLHRSWQAELVDFDGDPQALSEVRPALQSCLQSAEKATEAQRGIGAVTSLILLLLVSLLGWGAFHWWQSHAAEQRLLAAQQAFVAQLRDTPGLSLNEVNFDGPILWVHGLRDPLAQDPRDLLSASGLDRERVELNFRPYLDLSGQFALQRAVQGLSPPDTVQLTMPQANRLQAIGVAEPAWRERARLIATLVPGIEQYDDSALVSGDRQLLQVVQRVLKPPPDIRLDVQDAWLTVHGHAPLVWLESLAQRLAPVVGLRGFDQEAVADEQRQFSELMISVDGMMFRFTEGSELGVAQQQRLDAAARDLLGLRALAERLGYQLWVDITGGTDGVGLPVVNEQLALSRALALRDSLAQRGLPATMVRLHTRTSPPGEINSVLRRADLRVRYQRAGD